MKQHGEAAPHGVDLLFLIKRHHLFRQFLPVIAVELLQPAHFRGEFLHVRHGPVGRCGKGVEEQLHRKGEQDNGQSPVVN